MSLLFTKGIERKDSYNFRKHALPLETTLLHVFIFCLQPQNTGEESLNKLIMVWRSCRKMALLFCILSVLFLLWCGGLPSESVDADSVRDLHEFQRARTVANHKNHSLNGLAEHFFVFAQVSDLHVSVLAKPDRRQQLKHLLDVLAKSLRPEVVVASGDLTDALADDWISSMQREEEWKTYQQLVLESGLSEQSVWLDVRGNHDRFGVPRGTPQEDYFLSRSIQGPKNTGSYLHRHKTASGDTVAFVAVDATPTPGLKRMFNFFGILSKEQMADLQELSTEAEKSKYAIWFGHYPPTIINAHKPGLPYVMRNSLAYLCGHLHTIFGFANTMYRRSDYGNLHLELSDWKTKRKYRVMVIDNGFFSFVDVIYPDWPVVLVTHPKASSTLMPEREPWHLGLSSTHIRVLAFSETAVKSVTICLDTCKNASRVKTTNLWTLPWTPEKFKAGLHVMTVGVTDRAGSSKTIQHKFSLDGTTTDDFAFLGKLYLTYTGHELLRLLAISVLFLITISNVSLYVHFRLVERRKIAYPHSRFLQKQLLMSSVPYLFWPTALLPYFLLVLPVVWGEIIEQNFGMTFVFGEKAFSNDTV